MSGNLFTRATVLSDKTPRGLVNVYYHVHQINLMKQEETFKSMNVKEQNEKLFKSVKSLIDTILSSSVLVERQRHFLENILLWGSTAENTQINYAKLESDINHNTNNNATEIAKAIKDSREVRKKVTTEAKRTKQF